MIRDMRRIPSRKRREAARREDGSIQAAFEARAGRGDGEHQSLCRGVQKDFWFVISPASERSKSSIGPSAKLGGDGLCNVVPEPNRLADLKFSAAPLVMWRLISEVRSES